MITHSTQTRVRYAETDQMGYVYYGKYAEYFEMGRAELVRRIGIPYSEMEKRGILMPVSQLEIRYFRPAFYDDLLTIKTTVPEKPGARFITICEVSNEKGDKIVEGKVTLAFINANTMRPTRVPDFVMEAGERYWGRDLSVSEQGE